MVQTKEIEYRVVCDKVSFAADGEVIAVNTYGIAAYRKGRKLCQISDITLDKARLEELVQRCMRGGLSLCHLHDVVEDFLGQE